eukprot:5655809-Pyramimonas_sp.AAC.1
MMLASSGPPGGRLRGLLGASWSVLGHIGGIFGGLGGILDPLGPSWRPSWTLLGRLGAPALRPRFGAVARWPVGKYVRELMEVRKAFSTA